MRAASVAWATADELCPELRQTAGVQEGQGTSQVAGRTDAPVVQAGRGPAREQPGERVGDGLSDALQLAAEPARAETATPGRVAADVWLIPPRASPDSKDSLGRGLDAGSMAAVVAADPAVQRERAARWSYLQGAYRDPHAARAALDEMVKREEWTSAAARLAREPEKWGELRGRVGWLASAAAKQERAAAERAAGAVLGSLERVGEAQVQASRVYRAGVEGQLVADAVGIPRLSARTEAAIGALRAAPDEAACAQAWRAAQRDERVAAELGTFRKAVTRRFGDEGVRQMLRAGGQSGVVHVPSIVPDQRPALEQVTGLTAALKVGEQAEDTLVQREEESERQGQRRGLRYDIGKRLLQCKQRPQMPTESNLAGPLTMLGTNSLECWACP